MQVPFLVNGILMNLPLGDHMIVTCPLWRSEVGYWSEVVFLPAARNKLSSIVTTFKNSMAVFESNENHWLMS